MKRVFLTVCLAGITVAAFGQDASAVPAQNTPAAAPQSPALNARAAATATAAAVLNEEDENPALKDIIVAYLDLEYVFKNHPWTVECKLVFSEEIKDAVLKIEELNDHAETLRRQNEVLLKEAQVVQPFYKGFHLPGEGKLLPLPDGGAVRAEYEALVTEIIFGGMEMLDFSPVNPASAINRISGRIEENRVKILDLDRQIAELRRNSLSGVKEKERQDIDVIMKDIYSELKTYSKRRNVSVVVNNKDVLYGASPVDITQDFMTRVKKGKKRRYK